MNDVSFTLTIGKNRTAKNWIAKKTSWLEFIDSLKTPIRTPETVKEYAAMSREQRAQAKDVGAFVGGTFSGKRRLLREAVNRQLVTLDADSPSPDFLSDVDLFLGQYAYAIYSTHSHTQASPRYRLILPLAEPVSPEAYQAIARKLADTVGIDNFDSTTYDVHRLMYFPSAAVDGDYEYYTNDAPILDGKDILAQYKDWKDTSQWPTGKAETLAVKHAAAVQGDPLEKPGYIGAFNRIYFPIQKAIAAFLKDEYSPCDNGRYTYLLGTTAGGLVIYSDRFAYSHHSTDPSCGMLCSAYDLVRVHLFGKLDEDARSNTSVEKLPSSVKMKEFVQGLNTVEKEYIRTMNADLFDEEADEAASEELEEWLSKLEYTKDKEPRIKPSAKNVLLIMANDRNLKDTFGLNTFSQQLDILKDLPWRGKEEGEQWQDSDDSQLRNYFDVTYKLQARAVIEDAFIETANKHRFHPVRDYLNSLKWDGVPRAETLFIDFLNAVDTNFTREATVNFLKAAVARVFHAGCKFDNCITFSGAQGIGKTTLLGTLGKKWYNESLTSFNGKDPLEQLQGSWIVELGEMQATKKAENDQIKAFLSRRVDKFRKSFGKRVQEYPRQCVFAATTNDLIFLKDRTGGRRFWPIIVAYGAKKDPSLDLTEEYVNSVWAEAVYLYRKNPSLLLSKAALAEVEELQDSFTEGLEKVGLIEDYLDKKLPDNWKDMELFERRAYLDGYSEEDEKTGTPRTCVCTLEIWCEVFGGERGKANQYELREISAIMQRMKNWDGINRTSGNPYTARVGKLYGKQRVFMRTKNSD